MKKYYWMFVFALLSISRLLADPAATSAEENVRLQKLSDGLNFQSGKIQLPGGIAVITLPDDFRYLSPKDTETVLADLWRNPRSADSLGMIVPAAFNPMLGGSWAVILNYTADGFVKDNDAATIDYTKLLTQMKEGVAESSKERQKQGYDSIELIGWAAPPRYDQANHKLYWAKELRFGNRHPDTLNYNIRMLGRRGVLVLNAVANLDQLSEVEEATPALLKMVNFQEGHRYADFDPSSDKVATYGLAALVVGGIAAKAGFFKLLLVGILAAKKFILFGLIAIGGFFKKLFQRRKNPYQAEPLPAPEPSKNEDKTS